MHSKIELLKTESKVRDFKSRTQLNKAELEEMRSNLNRALMRAELELVNAERDKEKLRAKYGGDVMTSERELEWSKTQAMDRSAVADAQAGLEQFQRAMEIAGEAVKSKDEKDQNSSEPDTDEQPATSAPTATDSEP